MCLTSFTSAKTSGIKTSRFDSTNNEERRNASSSVAVVLFSLKGVPRLCLNSLPWSMKKNIREQTCLHFRSCRSQSALNQQKPAESWEVKQNHLIKQLSRISLHCSVSDVDSCVGGDALGRASVEVVSTLI